VVSVGELPLVVIRGVVLHASNCEQRLLGSVDSLVEYFYVVDGGESASASQRIEHARAIKLIILAFALDIYPVLGVVRVGVSIAAHFLEGSLLIKVLEEDQTAPRLLVAEGP